MGGKGGSKKVTVGYRYSWDIQSGLGRGPVNELVAISADKKNVFAGTEGQISASTTVAINKPNLFGGEDTGGEGGIQGLLEVQMGDANQLPSPRLSSIMSGLIPGFRGLVTTFYSGLISCYSASPKPWSFRVRRSTKGWDNGAPWYPEKALIRLSNPDAILENDDVLTDAQRANLRTIHAMNPAHILMECATNRDWGRGLTYDFIDLDSYRQAADVLFNEGFGLCFRYNRQDSLDSFIQQILDHIGAAQYADLETGKLHLALIRADYDPNQLPLFTLDNGIIEVQDDDNASSDNAVNEVVVTFHDPVTHTDGEARAQNLGSIASVGLISSSSDYKALPTYSLAARVAQRELEVGASGITRLVIQFDRRGSSLAPASCFRVSLPDRNISTMILRVGKIEEGDDGALTITAVQDVFGMPATVWSSGEQGNEWQPPNKTAQPVTQYQLLELPYLALVSSLSAADLNMITDSSCYLGVLASAPSATAINYLLQTSPRGGEWVVRGTGDWTDNVTLYAPVGVLDTVFPVSGADVALVVGMVALVDNEIIRIDEVDLLNQRITVGRGCGDSLPAPHAAGVVIWHIIDIESDNLEYIGGDIVDARLLTQTSVETLNPTLAPVISQQMAQRQARPYPPSNIKINDISWPTSVDDASEFVVSWSYRDRIMQADQLIDCLAGNIGPEPGVVYCLALVDDSQTVVWSAEAELDTQTLPYSTASSTGNENHQLQVWSRRAGLDSFYRYEVQMPPGKVI
ncbi:hypothetical protein I2492_06105 [Budviciaceae bacterium CWB-B4]|uniref:Tip attachment protein J domain-containing protein n=1 Tax=Limnobaculum xujianqingii TaxID=2738837 RepID=A0A9D7AH30_9GAMM|nr:hypothetical protein [Limnobaculum xujianqingii]MBK5072582.1 hypothetical protein [Limnobaculum xujianqingii]MBK5175891.1 hypothetical protein [Limnobaculum xujianqingii]